MATLNSCASDKAALDAAARQQAQADARVIILPLPEDCDRREPHATYGVGSDKMAVLLRERGALDRSNDRVQRCYALHNDQAKALR